MGFDNAAADRKANSHASLLGGKEGLKQARFDLLSKAVAGVRNGDADHLFLNWYVRNGQLPTIGRQHRFERVAEEVYQNLLDLDAIGENKVTGRIELEAQHHALFAGADQPECTSFFDQLGNAFHPLLRFASRHEAAQSTDDLAGTNGLL